MSFKQFLVSIGFTDPAADTLGMDDAARFRRGPAGPQLIEIPSHPVTGNLQVKVLLVDFPDRQGSVPPQHYADMLFSSGIYPTGSMRDFYKEISLGKVDVNGSVHGWLRMPKPYSYYTNNQSGLKAASYPHNAQRMAEDAVSAALQQGIQFGADLDKLNQGIVTPVHHPRRTRCGADAPFDCRKGNLVAQMEFEESHRRGERPIRHHLSYRAQRLQSGCVRP